MLHRGKVSENIEKRKQATLLVLYESATGNHGYTFHIGSLLPDRKCDCEPAILGCTKGSTEWQSGYVGDVSGNASHFGNFYGASICLHDPFSQYTESVPSI